MRESVTLSNGLVGSLVHLWELKIFFVDKLVVTG